MDDEPRMLRYIILLEFQFLEKLDILKPWPNDANIYPNKCQHYCALLDIVGCGVAKRTQHLYPTFICLSQQHQQQQQHRINYSTLRSRIRGPPPPLIFFRNIFKPLLLFGAPLIKFSSRYLQKLGAINVRSRPRPI